MTELERFQDEAKPRSLDLCEPYVRKFVPIFGIVMWGIVYFPLSLAPPILLGAVLAPFIDAAHPGPGPLPPTWLFGLGLLLVAAYLAGWVPYALWVRRWRGTRRRLLREGDLFPATFAKRTQKRDSEGHIITWCYYRFIVDGKARTTVIGEEDRSVTVLYHPGSWFGVIFVDGALCYVNKWYSDVQAAEQD
jgi:hypothetical protein